MTTNQERAAEVIEGYYPPCQTCRARATVGIPEVGECDECAKECQYIAQALADAGLLAPDPQTIRTIEQLDALDPDTALLLSSSMRSADWEITHDNDLPAVVIATGEQVRAARQVLEQEKK